MFNSIGLLGKSFAFQTQKYPDLCAYGCDLPDANNGYLKRTFGAGDQKKWAFSLWWYPYTLGVNPQLFTCYVAGEQTSLWVSAADKIQFYSSATGGGFNLITTPGITQQFNHIYVEMDTAQATASNRLKMWLNGALVTSYSTATYPAQNATPLINSANNHNLAGVADTSYSDDIHAAPVFIGGALPGVSYFGQVSPLDSSWVYKEPAGLTYGTNGFYLNYAASGDMGNDVSGNNNDFTATNCTQTTTTPTSA